MDKETRAEIQSTWTWRYNVTYALAEAFAIPKLSFVRSLARRDWARRARMAVEEMADLAPESAEALVGILAVADTEYADRDLKEATEQVKAAFKVLHRGEDPKIARVSRAYREFVDGTDALELLLADCEAITVRAAASETVDTIDNELELLSFSAGAAVSIVRPRYAGVDHCTCYRTFLYEHFIIWAAEFAEAVRSHTDDPFYKAAAALLEFYLEVERELDIPEARKSAGGAIPMGCGCG